MPRNTVQLECLHGSTCGNRDSALQTAAAAPAAGSPAPPASAFKKENTSFLGIAGAAGLDKRKTPFRCLRVAAAAACAASLLQQQQQTGLRANSGSNNSSRGTAFVASPSLASSDCSFRSLLVSDASVSAASCVHRPQKQQKHQQQQRRDQKRFLAVGMTPGRLPVRGDAAEGDTPAAVKTYTPAEAAVEASTDAPSEAAVAAEGTEGGDFVQLDKTSFRKHEEVTCLRVPLQHLQELSKALGKYLFRRRNFRPVISDNADSSQHEERQQQSQHKQLPVTSEQEPPGTQDKQQQKCERETPQKGGGRGFKLLLLDPSIGPGKLSRSRQDKELEGLPDTLQSLLKEKCIEVLRRHVFLGYENLSVEECLAALLPTGVETPHRFECVGHIAHLNLPAALLKFKYAIGQVVLDKHPQLRTVVLKTGIGSKWRELQFELIAGEAEYVAKVKESDIVFEVDYARAFWNSRSYGVHEALWAFYRLSCERQRITAIIPRRSVVLDAFAGVGAFAVFLARRGCVVAANDGNPASAANMQTNVKRNRVANLVDIYNQDARDFLRSQAQPAAIAALMQKLNQTDTRPSKETNAAAETEDHESAVEVHVLMNLPELAIEFLGRFLELLHLPILKWDPNPEREFRPRVEASLGCWPEPVEIQEVGAPLTLCLRHMLMAPGFIELSHGQDSTNFADSPADHALPTLADACLNFRYEMWLLTNGCIALHSTYLSPCFVANAAAVLRRQLRRLHLSNEQSSSSPRGYLWALRQ
ncbi:met-10 domain-containing protein, putative [Eimeria brunetti]|uniref:tRNA (guanine(37)-N1)-methyltransferase n=1 Tax=Eimeria brunetti TaxID=51314 RepID=U6LJ03_9EIME|nr:met-10 domain-containing protein, putative [Eimeria brunetti]